MQLVRLGSRFICKEDYLQGFKNVKVRHIGFGNYFIYVKVYNNKCLVEKAKGRDDLEKKMISIYNTLRLLEEVRT